MGNHNDVAVAEHEVEALEGASERLNGMVDRGSAVRSALLEEASQAVGGVRRLDEVFGRVVASSPGIMPITNVDQVYRFTAKIGASIPAALREALQSRIDDPPATLQLGVAWATLQCTELLRAGAPGIHFITLNRSPATRAILSALRIARPWAAED